MSLPLLVFDVNETLLDLDALAPHFKRMFGESQPARSIGRCRLRSRRPLPIYG